MKFKKGDTVKVLRGKDRGKTGKIEKALPKLNQVLVTGINVYKKHIKSRQGQSGGIVDIVKPLPASQVMLVCPACSKIVRIGYQVNNKTKERICKKCGVGVDKKIKKKE